MIEETRKHFGVAYFLSVAAMIISLAMSLLLVPAGKAGTPDSCPDMWRGDLNNICEDID